MNIYIYNTKHSYWEGHDSTTVEYSFFFIQENHTIVITARLTGSQIVNSWDNLFSDFFIKILRFVLCYQSRSVTCRSQTKGSHKKNDKCWTELGRGGRGRISKKKLDLETQFKWQWISGIVNWFLCSNLDFLHNGHWAVKSKNRLDRPLHLPSFYPIKNN